MYPSSTRQGVPHAHPRFAAFRVRNFGGAIRLLFFVRSRGGRIAADAAVCCSACPRAVRRWQKSGVFLGGNLVVAGAQLSLSRATSAATVAALLTGGRTAPADAAWGGVSIGGGGGGGQKRMRVEAFGKTGGAYGEPAGSVERRVCVP